MTDAEIANTLVFLDRVQITGHSERHAMNAIEAALVKMQKANTDPAPKTAPKEAPKKVA